MSEEPGWVLDASAFLCYALSEPGSKVVEAALLDTAAITAVNFAEVLSRYADHGQPCETILR